MIPVRRVLWVAAFSFLLASSSSAQSLPSCNVCADPLATSCFEECVQCLPPYSVDGHCINARVTTCGEIWGCCPSYVRADSVVIGVHEESAPPVCLAIEYNRVRYVDTTGCRTDIFRCDQDLQFVYPWDYSCGWDHPWTWGDRC